MSRVSHPSRPLSATLAGVLLSAGLLLVAPQVSASSGPDRLRLGDQDLSLTATARACHWRIIELFDAAYYRAADGGARCVQLNYLRDFTAEQLGEATRRILEKELGELTAPDAQAGLQAIEQAYEAVGSGDSYTYCVTAAGGGLLQREGETVAALAPTGFATDFLRIWIESDDGGQPDWNFRPCG